MVEEESGRWAPSPVSEGESYSSIVGRLDQAVVDRRLHTPSFALAYGRPLCISLCTECWHCKCLRTYLIARCALINRDCAGAPEVSSLPVAVRFQPRHPRQERRRRSAGASMHARFVVIPVHRSASSLLYMMANRTNNPKRTFQSSAFPKRLTQFRYYVDPQTQSEAPLPLKDASSSSSCAITSGTRPSCTPSMIVMSS